MMPFLRLVLSCLYPCLPFLPSLKIAIEDTAATASLVPDLESFCCEDLSSTNEGGCTLCVSVHTKC